MKILKTMIAMCALTVGCFNMVGCEKDGPAENAGEKIDEAVDDMKDTAEEVGNDIADKVDDVKDKMD